MPSPPCSCTGSACEYHRRAGSASGGAGPHHGLRRRRHPAGRDVHGGTERDLRDHGRQRRGQEHAHAPHDRPEPPRSRGGPLPGRGLLGGGRRGARDPQAALRRALPGRRALELDDAGRERLPAPGREAWALPRGSGRSRPPQARPRGARRLRGALPLRDQPGDAQAGGARSGHGPRPRHPLPRRAVGGARPPELAAARRPHPRAAGDRGHDLRARDPRARQHLRARRQRRVPRRGAKGRDRQGQAERAAGEPGAEGAGLPEPGPAVSARTHARAVGVFVLGAVALVLAAILLLSSGNWLARRDRFSVYFPGSVKGLSDGAPVTFRGVKVGQVHDIQAILTDRPEALIQIEVVIEIEHSVVAVPPGQAVPAALDPKASREDFAHGLLERGVRARLVSASFLTGQKYIDLDFLPQEPARFAGLRPRYTELPTMPTAMEKLGDRAETIVNKLADLPVDQMLDDLRKALQAAREVMESRDLRDTLAAASRGARKMESTLAQLETTFQTADQTLGALRSETGPTADEARQTLRGFRATAERAQESLDVLKGTLRGTDDTRLTATQALNELTHTMQVVRNLVDYLQTHPEAVVMGKERSKEAR